MTHEELLRVAEDLYRIAWLYVTPRERTELVALWERIHAPTPEVVAQSPRS